jgi:16S rRNA (uracil1498-N3)-methyltransferase
MDYFYTAPENISSQKVRIGGEEFTHLTHVMRKKQGDVIRVVDGLGMAYDIRLDEIGKGQTSGEILESYRNHNEPKISLTLGVGLLKNPSKFDFLVEKVTEIGVRTIVPLLTARTIPEHAKIDRWQKLALAAMKQSGRSYLPRIQELTELSGFLGQYGTADLRLVAHEQAVGITGVMQLINIHVRTVTVLIGPEGGFEEEEIEMCSAAGFTPVYFGERRLRTETAAIVAAASVLLG